MIQHRDTLMSGAYLLQRFDQHQRSNFVILVLQKVSSFNQRCRFRIPFCKVLVRRTAQLLGEPFVKGAFITSIVESAFIGVFHRIPKGFVQQVSEHLKLGFNLYRCNPTPVIFLT